MLHFAAFIASCTLAYLFTPLALLVAKRWGFVDHPSPRRTGEAKPRLGGMAMYLAFLGTVLATAPLVQGRTGEEAIKLAGVVIGASLVTLMGAWDDKRELGPLPQLAVQVLAALIAVSAGVLIDRVTNPLGTDLQNSMIYFPMPVAVIVTVVWIVGVINTINFIDGLDGLAAGVTAIAGLVLAAHSLQIGQYSIAVLPLALAGSTIGFLPHNFHPSKITMGTSGAAFLGFSIGTLSIVGGTKAATTLLVLAVPIIDAGWIIVSRVMSGRSPFVGDRRHLHYRLLDMGLSPRQIVITMYLICGTLGVAALVLSSRLFKLYSILGTGAFVAIALVIIARRTLGKGVDRTRSM